jgi:O-acetyl-ADP-ribose deacetylase (regulator of RNase III)
MNWQDPLETFLSGRVHVCVGDITSQSVDAIINAANSGLLGGGGVDGAIHYRGGPEILEQCRAIRRTRFPNGLPAGEAVLTTGGKLPAPYVIHTVGPICGPGETPDAALLGACYRNSVLLAAGKGLRSIAFPAISTGAFGYPREEAASVVSQALESVLQVSPLPEEVRLVFYERADATIFLRNHRFAPSPTGGVTGAQGPRLTVFSPNKQRG